MTVEREIRRRIRERGCIAFAEFMELALFWPPGGYYLQRRPIGASGDFYTSPHAHPAFGALLASVPLLIHLLNRQRHRPLEWAAMKFVLAAYRKTRRRAQLENLILLLLSV